LKKVLTNYGSWRSSSTPSLAGLNFERRARFPELPVQVGCGGPAVATQNSMKQLLRLFLLLLLLPQAAGNVRAADLVVSGHDDRAPFDWREGETIQGAAVDIIVLIFKDLHIDVKPRFVGPWARVMLNLKEGEIDVMCGVYETDERKKFAEFSVPFREDRISLFVWYQRQFRYQRWDDLRGKTFGDVIGASRGQDFDTWRKENAHVEYVKDNVGNLKKLEKGRIDCFVMSHDSGLVFVKRHGYEGRIIPLPQPVRTHELRYAISKKSPFVKYLPHINQRLAELRADGTIDRIIEENSRRYLTRAAADQDD
jgi:polar amino acid transport system substrate-binding protein